MLVFAERGKPEYPEKNLSEQRREPTTNSTHIWRRVRESNPGHIGGRRVLSPLRHPCSPKYNWIKRSTESGKKNCQEKTSALKPQFPTNCKQDQGVIKFKPLVLTRATESGNKYCRKTTSALEPQNTVQTVPGRENFSEIKPLVLVHARQSQVTKIGRKTTSALEPQNTV